MLIKSTCYTSLFLMSGVCNYIYLFYMPIIFTWYICPMYLPVVCLMVYLPVIAHLSAISAGYICLWVNWNQLRAAIYNIENTRWRKTIFYKLLKLELYISCCIQLFKVSYVQNVFHLQEYTFDVWLDYCCILWNIGPYHFSNPRMRQK